MPPNNLEASTMEKANLTEKQQFWQGHIDAQARSGLTRRQYCEQHALAAQQMGYYAAYLKKKTCPPKSRSGFIKLPVSGAISPSQMTIRLASGVSIECPSDARLVSEVLRSLN
jgi:hypothetical protein